VSTHFPSGELIREIALSGRGPVGHSLVSSSNQSGPMNGRPADDSGAIKFWHECFRSRAATTLQHHQSLAESVDAHRIGKVWLTAQSLIHSDFSPYRLSFSTSYFAAMAIMRSPYAGPSRKLVLAFDIGTTYSGVSYALLDPGFVPEIKSVAR